MTTAEIMKERRKELGVSVDVVASALGVSVATVYRYESGDIEKLPSIFLEPLARILQTTPAHLMGWESAPRTDSASNLSRFLNDAEQSAINKFRELNSLGQQKAIDYMDDLVQSDRYGKSSSGNLLSYGSVEKPAKSQRIASPVMIPTVKKDTD